ncbi:MAG: hypothetical protein HFG00_08440 [Oscillibacter sp.]|nr:hypothetical protein [Oscillibacter sp.]
MRRAEAASVLALVKPPHPVRWKPQTPAEGPGRTLEASHKTLTFWEEVEC